MIIKEWDGPPTPINFVSIHFVGLGDTYDIDRVKVDQDGTHYTMSLESTTKNHADARGIEDACFGLLTIQYPDHDDELGLCRCYSRLTGGFKLDLLFEVL